MALINPGNFFSSHCLSSARDGSVHLVSNLASIPPDVKENWHLYQNNSTGAPCWLPDSSVVNYSLLLRPLEF